MTLQPWELRSDDSRQADTLVTFIIFCEDGVCEPYYFEEFYVPDRLKIIANRKQGQSHENVINAIAKSIDNNMTTVVGGSHKIISENIWCVFDRDVNSGQSNVRTNEDLKFNHAISAGLQSGIKIAWSNDVFELWVLLHFEEVSGEQMLSKESIYTRLSQIFKDLPEKSPALAAIVCQDKFTYQHNLKNRHAFPLYVVPLLKDSNRRKEAIQRAKQLSALHLDNVPFHHRNPCTMVHSLVEELLKYAEDATA